MMARNIRVIFMAMLAVWFMSSCSSRPDNVQDVAHLPEIYPDYVGVTIPVDIAPLNFSMVDDAFTDIDVEVKGKKSGSMHTNGRYADFDIEEWHQLLKDNQGSQLVLTVCARKDGQWLKYKDFVIDVSNNPIGEWGITYRRIAPGYTIYGHMGLYQRCLSDF
jgi:hypothetical protein